MFWRVLLCLSIMAVMIGPMSFSTHALADETELQPYAVGMRQLHWVDETRENWAGNGPRPLVAYLWYPTTEDAEQKLVAFPPDEPIFIGGKAARNAPFLNDDQTRPLVLMSHGTGGSGLQMMWLGRRLASAGYLAVAVNHHGNTAAEPKYDARGFRLFWERATDLTVLLDQLLAEPELATHIDKNNISAVGFSLGGYTVSALGGGRIDFDQFHAFCESAQRDTTCDDQSEFPDADREFQRLQKIDPRIDIALAKHGNSYKDERIKSVVALAPAIGAAFTPKSLKAINIPFYFIVGGGDTIAPAASNAQRMAQHIPQSQVDILNSQAGHYVFLNPCSDVGRKHVSICQDGEGVVRDELHGKAAQRVLSFLQSTKNGLNEFLSS